MSFLQTIRNALQNLSEGQDMTAVRPLLNQQPSQEYLLRLKNSETTEKFLTSQIKPRISSTLHPSLDQALAHCEQPIISTEQLLQEISQRSRGQWLAAARSGWPADHQESRFADDLIELEKELAALLKSSPEA